MWEETFGGDEYVYGIDCGDSFTGVYFQTHPGVNIKYIQRFVYQSCFNTLA